MKKVSWLFVKFGFVIASLIFLYGFDLHNVSAQQKGCNKTQACSGGGVFSCHCGDSDCGGCYVPNGQGGCGTCAGGGEIILE